MRGAGILIIGSLWWDPESIRKRWRELRLAIDQAVHIKVPIRYGRRSFSRGNTFTMTFATNGALGQGFLVPCKSNLCNAHALLTEAKELWKAEDRNAQPDSIAASWGCVGVSFQPESTSPAWVQAWADDFRQRVSSPVPPIDQNGLLGIPWPATAADCAAGVDVILAVATKETHQPGAQEIADAWIDKGHEDYFFNNVMHDIRTPDDLLIFQRFEERQPSWLTRKAYEPVIAKLHDEE